MAQLKFDDRSTWPRSWSGMCEVIAEDMDFVHRETGERRKRTPLEVFNSSPTGELFQIYLWFMECAREREVKARFAAGERPEDILADVVERAKKVNIDANTNQS
jgi:hypothetical protein